jgi:SanA protein
MFPQRFKRALLILLLLALVFVPLANHLVAKSSIGRTYSDVSAIPHRQVGLLLGCTKRVRGGGENPFFAGRVDAAAQLYKAGKIDYILVSGDNNKNSYNEPLDMRDALLAAGVPRDRIYMDYAGFRTYDSVVRAKLVFGLPQATIISQAFHNARALYIAQHNGIDAVAYDAKAVAFRYSFSTQIREWFARTVAVLDVATGHNPRFLGPVVRIGIDAPVVPTSGSRR